jgi:acyl carrier protein
MTTSRTTIEDTVREVIREQLDVASHGSELGPDDDLWKMGMTSLTCLGLMLNTEDVFGIQLPDALLTESTFRSVRSIVAAVEAARTSSGDSG